MRINSAKYSQYRLLELLVLDESLTYKEMSEIIGVTDKTCKRWRERIQELKEKEKEEQKLKEQSEIELLKVKQSQIVKKIELLKTKFIKEVNMLIADFQNLDTN